MPANTVIHLKTFFEDARDGRLTAVRCRACGELALPSNEYTFSAPGYEASWTTSEVARRQPDGSWRYVIDNPYAAPVTS